MSPREHAAVLFRIQIRRVIEHAALVDAATRGLELAEEIGPRLEPVAAQHADDLARASRTLARLAETLAAELGGTRGPTPTELALEEVMS